MPPTIYNINQATMRGKMAAFDYDWTIVNPKDGKTFPSNVDDYIYLYPDVPDKIKQYYNDGYMIVVFTNQSKSWKCDQVQQVMTQLDIPLFIVIATEKCDYKPNPILFDTLFDNDGINKEESFFVGDALGRKSDFSDSDKAFAENIGVKWYSPEDIFANEQVGFEIPEVPLSTNPEIIIMVGYPGSGKTTIANSICKKNTNYIHIAGDIHKTTSKMRKAALDHILQSKSILFDATHSSIKKRNEFIEFGKKHHYEVICIHVKTSLDISYKRNKSREDSKQVPKIAYSVYKKYYEEPTEEEGFKSIYII